VQSECQEGSEKIIVENYWKKLIVARQRSDEESLFFFGVYIEERFLATLGMTAF